MKRFTNITVVLWGAATVLFAMMMVGTAEIVVIVPVLICLWRFIVTYRRYKSPEYQRMQQESRRDYQELREQNRRLAERQKNAKQIRAEIERRDRTPVSTVLISTRDITGKSLTGTAARAAIGYALFGVFGAGVGMTTAKTKVVGQKATFSVKYESGRTAVKTVDVGSSEFNELAKLLVE